MPVAADRKRAVYGKNAAVSWRAAARDVCLHGHASCPIANKHGVGVDAYVRRRSVQVDEEREVASVRVDYGAELYIGNRLPVVSVTRSI